MVRVRPERHRKKVQITAVKNYEQKRNIATCKACIAISYSCKRVLFFIQLGPTMVHCTTFMLSNVSFFFFN